LTKRELVGEVGVDSGTLFLVDPGYLSDAKRLEDMIPRLKEGIKREELAGNIPMADNLRRLVKEKGEIQKLIFDWQGFCKIMPREIDNCASGLIIPTHADGGYKVYAVKNKNDEITKLEIVF
jgi:hypothetical protein